MVLGIPDLGISAAYILCILSTAACVVYGCCNWNKGGEDEMQQIMEEAEWEKIQQEVDADL